MAKPPFWLSIETAGIEGQNLMVNLRIKRWCKWYVRMLIIGRILRGWF